MLKHSFWLGILVLSACGGEDAATSDQVSLEPSAQQITFAENAIPSEPELGAIYDRSCRLCHSVIGTNSPLTGHNADWQARLTARGGMEGLLASTKNGFGLMPARGQCFDCSDEQYIELIAFMAKDGGQ